MHFVKPFETTTLLLRSSYEPFAFLSARAVVKYLITEKVKGLDADGNLFGFFDENVNHFPDTPLISSAKKDWFVPTIVRLYKHFGYHPRRNHDAVSLKSLYKHYRGVCQYCMRDIPFHEATRDHYHPKSKGGTDHDFNLVLACKRCNRLKGDAFPYKNRHGFEVAPKPLPVIHILSLDGVEMRDEWRTFLFKN